MTSTARTAERPKVRMVCNTCGSEDVLLDAWAEWDKAKQRWRLSEIFTAAVCGNCDGECSISEKPL
jgi:hypothetical protein